MTPLSSVTPDKIKAYQEEITRSSSPSTVKRKTASLNKFLDWAESEGHIAQNPIPQATAAVLIPSDTPVITSKKSTMISAKTWAILAGTLMVVVITFFTVLRLDVPIPFITNRAAEGPSPNPVAVNTIVIPTPSPRVPFFPTSNIPADSALNSTPTPEPTASPTPTPSADSQLTGAISSLKLFGDSPTIDASGGDLLIEGKTVTVKTTDGSDGDITLNPDGNGTLELIFEGDNQNFLSAAAANLSSGTLIYGNVANNATGYNLLQLQNGASPITRFNVDASGNVYASGSINTPGNIQINGVTRLNSLGRLTSITGYYQDSGLFEIDQGAPDYAKITKALSTVEGVSTADLLSLTLDESVLSSGSNTNTLVLNRLGGNSDALALFVDTGNVRIDGNINAKGNLTLGDASGDTITFNGRVNSNILPSASATYDLGSSSLLWNNVYATSFSQNGNLVCDASGANCPAGSTQYWQQTAAGVLFPLNSSVDFLIGSSATASAKFAFTGVSSGTPTASISGTTANVATFIDGNGNISTTNRTNLLLGNSSTYDSTGNILLNPNGTGNVGIGTTSPGVKLHVYTNPSVAGLDTAVTIENDRNGSSNDVYLNLDKANGAVSEAAIQFQVLGTNQFKIYDAADVLRFEENGGSGMAISNLGRVGIGTTTPNTLLDVAGAASISGTLTVGNGTSNRIQSAFGPLSLAYKSGDDAWTNGLTLIDVSGDVDIAGGSTSTGCTVANSTGNLTCTGLVTAGARSSANSYTVYVSGGTYYAVSNYGGTNYSNATLTTLIESVVADLNTLGGGSVFFQAGTFDMGTGNFTCNAQHDIEFAGQGIDATFIQNSSDAAADTEPLSFTNCKRWTIRDMTVSAGGTARSSSDAIDVDQGDDFLIERVKITDSRSRGIVFDGKDLTGTGTADRNIIRNNIITSSSIDGDGIELLASSRNIITGNKIYDIGGHGIQLNKSSATASQANKPSQYNTVIGNDIYNVGQDGININSSSNNMVTGNSILNSANVTASRDGVRIQVSDAIACSFNIVNGNTITDDQGTDTQRYGVNISDTECSYNTVANNYIEGNLTGNINDSGTQTQYSQYIAGTNYIAKTIVTDTDGTTDYLGIGDTTPTSRLDITDIITTAGTIINATASAITSGNIIKLGTGGNNGNFTGNGLYMDFDNTGGNSFTGNFLKFDNAGTTKFTLDASANASQSGNLTFYGTSPTIATTGMKNLIIGDANTGGLILNGLLPVPGGTLGDICISGTNVVLATGTSCATSSQRYKNTIETSNVGLSEVLKMRPVTFYYNDDPEKKSLMLGFIAEEVDKIDPKLVAYNKEGLPDSVRYENYTAVLTKAIQEQQAQITALADSVVSNIVLGAQTTKDFIAENIKAGAIITSDLATSSFTALEGTVDNLLVKSGLIAGNIETQLISPLSNETDVAIRLGSESTPSGKLAIQDSNGTEVASIDSTGNAAFSGTVKSDSTVTNTLVADSIKSKSLDDIKSLLTQVESNQDLLKETVSWNIATATQSASFDSLASGELYISGVAAIDSLYIAKRASIGTDLILSSGQNQAGGYYNSIDTLSAPLRLQVLAAAPIELMAGLIKIDTLGNMSVAGNLYVAGKIESSGLSIKDDSNNIVASVNASGSANFNSVSTENLIIAGSAIATNSGALNGVITTNSNIGSASIPAGVSDITIKNPKVTDYSLVYVTPTSDSENKVLYVKSKKEGEFVVGFTDPISKETNFNWWIVQIQN